MFQLTYSINDSEQLLQQLSDQGAQFLSKGPVQETYFALPGENQLRLDQGMNADLVLIIKQDHYQELIDASIAQYKQLNEVLAKGLGESGQFTKHIFRYHFKNVLLEIHEYEHTSPLLTLQAEDLQILKSIARQLGLSDADRLTKTSLDL